MVLHEFRGGQLKPRERLLFGGGMAVAAVFAGIGIWATTLKLLDLFGVFDGGKLMLTVHGVSFLSVSVLAFAFAATPLAVITFRESALDGISRRWRRLQPLRRDLALVVPPVAGVRRGDHHHGRVPRSRSVADLHQVDIEIRDSILQLRPYFRDVGSEHLAEYEKLLQAIPGQRQYAEMALQLADALAAMAAGERPPDVPAPAALKIDDTEDLEEDSAEVLRLARWWPSARRAVRKCRRRARREMSAPRMGE